ncbi:hypothetical protein ACUH9Y_08905 [Dermabacteraceae bacterium P13115]
MIRRKGLLSLLPPVVLPQTKPGELTQISASPARSTTVPRDIEDGQDKKVSSDTSDLWRKTASEPAQDVQQDDRQTSKAIFQNGGDATQTNINIYRDGGETPQSNVNTFQNGGDATQTNINIYLSSNETRKECFAVLVVFSLAATGLAVYTVYMGIDVASYIDVLKVLKELIEVLF